MTTKTQPGTTSWKVKDVVYGVLGFAIGFAISFTITNSMQRDTSLGRAATKMGAATASSDALPPGHPPIEGGATSGSAASMGMPPPLPSLEPTAGPGPKAEDVFKDIQVLRGLPPTRVQRIMGIITVSLGVDCNYCHVPGSFESAHPKKAITRTMIRMVKKINKDFVGGKVNCYTCHRGSPKPATQ